MTANFTGVWRLDADASTFHGPAPAGLLMKIEHAGPDLTQHIIATNAAGAEQRRVFACRIGEETISAVGETTLTVHAYWQDGDETGELIIETMMSRQERDLHFKDCWSLSEDGACLVMAHRDDALEGQTVILTRDDSAAARFEDIPTPA
jgi:hypothetical protein